MKREMSYQTVDLSGVCDRNSLHDRLQESLTLPSWYGRNLDALYDALTDAPGPIHICFTAWKGMEEADPAYFKMFRSVLQAIRAELPGSSFLFSEEDSAEGQRKKRKKGKVQRPAAAGAKMIPFSARDSRPVNLQIFSLFPAQVFERRRQWERKEHLSLQIYMAAMMNASNSWIKWPSTRRMIH